MNGGDKFLDIWQRECQSQYQLVIQLISIQSWFFANLRAFISLQVVAILTFVARIAITFLLELSTLLITIL